jgi:hypothetical protein
VPNEDIASQVNTINKMAQKRALVAATLIAVNASEFFTQDLEDWGEYAEIEPKHIPQKSAAVAYGDLYDGERPEWGERTAPPQRPYDAATVKAALLGRAVRGYGRPAAPNQIPFVARKFTEAFAPAEDATDRYHLSLWWLTGETSANDLTFAWAKALLDWLLGSNKPDETGDTPLSEFASAEAGNVYRQAMKDQGQTEMKLEDVEAD